MAEREGFEPPVPFDITGFQDQRLKPLGHLSPDENRLPIIAWAALSVNALCEKSAVETCVLVVRGWQGRQPA